MSPSRRTLLLSGLAGACTSAWPAFATSDGLPDYFELPAQGMERVAPTMWVKPLGRRVWVTCYTWEDPTLGDVPANGLIVGGDTGATIIDTGVTPQQGQLLLGLAERLTGRRAVQAVATHFHDDRTGGAGAMRDAGVPVYGHPFTTGLAQAYGFPVPAPVRGLEKGPVSLGPVELFYPGVGHSRDNITAWHEDTGTLFGGCLLRATTDRRLGNLQDGDLDAFAATLERLAERYPRRRTTIPGHGSMAGDALTWTQGRVAAALEERRR